MLAAILALPTGMVAGPQSAAAQAGALTQIQRQRIVNDVGQIAALGFKRIRIITFVRYPGDHKKRNWPSNVFITFPKPTADELQRLAEYLTIIDEAGLSYEFVLLMPGSNSRYYSQNVTGEDYKTFIDRLWTVIWTGKLDTLLVGGDLKLQPRVMDDINPDKSPNGRNIVEAQRRWIKEIWPHVTGKCPRCNIGIGLLTGHATFWDHGVRGLHWIRENIKPAPKFVGLQYYPTTRRVLRRLGFVKGGEINWRKAVRTWYGELKSAAGGLPLLVDETGLNRNRSHSQEERARFFRETLAFFIDEGLSFNLWEYADHPGMSRFGLMDVNRKMRPSVVAIKRQLRRAAARRVRAGIQYIPPRTVGMQFIMPPDKSRERQSRKRQSRARQAAMASRSASHIASAADTAAPAAKPVN